ncbi:uncharacterized protein LOC143636600 [Bidens hawaiensis]|uniref:uncharacterized protein LOC143636600 n=1 Tax=Bidens hawaiensis TaxID=980011 RepID=UPI00404B3FAC
MNEQVQDLLHAGIIRESQYQTWVANPVIVPKSNGTWRMCIDFKDLNKACPKDYYPLPDFDLKVDVVAPFKFKLRHILLQNDDLWIEKRGCYISTFDGRGLQGSDWVKSESYMDDLVIKSVEEDQMLRDIEERLRL